MTFDPTKPVMTRDGRKVRIICTDRKDENFCGDYPLVVLVTASSGSEFVRVMTAEGTSWKCPPATYKGDDDLVNVERIEVEVDVWRNRSSGEVYTANPVLRASHSRLNVDLLGTHTIAFDHPAT